MKILYGALVLVLTVPTGAQGDPLTVVSTLVRPADVSGYAVTQPLADAFVAPFDGYLYSMTAVLGRDDGLFYGSPASRARLAIYTDQSGLPGVPLEALEVTGFFPDGGYSDTSFIKTARSVTRPLLVSGTTYWFVVSGVDGVVDWGAGSPCCNWPQAVYRDGVWTVDETFPGAFMITATAKNFGPVTEPATLMLAGAGLLASLSRGFRPKKNVSGSPRRDS